MDKTTVKIIQADWRRHHSMLRAFRRRVYLEELGIPPEFEWVGREPADHDWRGQGMSRAMPRPVHGPSEKGMDG